jgi:PAS domain S-box-containing protein
MRKETVHRTTPDPEIAEDLYGIVYRLDALGCVTFINSAGLSVLECSADEVLGKHFSVFLPDDKREQTVAHYANCISEQRAHDYYEVPWLSSAGELTYFGQYTSFKYKDGYFAGAAVIAHCITEQKESALEQQTTNQRLSRLVSSLDDAILVEDETSHIHLVNQQFCDLFGIPAPPDALKGADCSQAAEQSKALFKDPEGFVKRIEELLQARERVVGEVIEMADGRIVERSYIPVFLDSDYKGHLWRYTDVSHRHHIQRRLEEQEEKYRKILENMNLGILEVDNHDRIVRVYDAMQRLTGYSEEELLGRRASEVFIPKGTDPGMADKLRDRQQKKSDIYSATLRKKDGNHIEVLISGAPIVSRGEVVGSIGIHYDITELITVQRDLRIAKQQAEEVQRKEKELRQRITHELKLPLEAMRSMVDPLAESLKNSIHAHHLRLVRDTSELLHQTVLESFNDESGDDPSTVEVATDIASLSATLVGVMRALPQRPDLEINEQVDGEPAPRFTFNRALLFQSLLNLMSFVKTQLKGGEIALGYFLELADDDQERYVTFTITGKGGFTKKTGALIRSMVAAPEQLPDELRVARALIDQLNGELAIEQPESNLLQLSCSFRMTLASTEEEAADGKEADIRNLRILVLEKTVLNREYLQLLFNRWEVEHVVTDDPKKALALQRTQPFAVVLTDLNLPEVKSGAVASAIRAFEREKKLHASQIIALSSFAQIELPEALRGEGVTEVVQKPFKPSTLRQLLERLVQQVPQDDDDPFERFRVLETNYFTSKEQLMKLTAYFAEDIEDYKAISARCLAEEDIKGLRQRIHKIRPSFSMTAMDRSFALATTIEEGIDRAQLDAETLRKLHDELLSVLDNEYAGLKKYVELRAAEDD